jgi:sialic acid synthase SpsE
VDFPETLALAVTLGCRALKVCSGDVTHLAWIRAVARAGLPVLLDTGNATLGEIEQAVDAVWATGQRALVIHHCPSGYPARLESVNLRVIPSLRQFFPSVPIGFSDHTPGWDMDVAAVGLGANQVEKTLTLDRAQAGPEHAFSLEPAEAAAFVQAIRDLERALGSPRRILTEAEALAKAGARRSLFAIRDLAVGVVGVERRHIALQVA